MIRRIVLHTAVLLIVLSGGLQAHADSVDVAEVRGIIADRAEAHGQSPSYLTAVADCETGGTFDPRSIGRQGERGLFQLHPRGELLGFISRGYSDPFDPWQNADYAAIRFSEGASRAWTCA